MPAQESSKILAPTTSVTKLGPLGTRYPPRQPQFWLFANTREAVIYTVMMQVYVLLFMALRTAFLLLHHEPPGPWLAVSGNGHAGWDAWEALKFVDSKCRNPEECSRLRDSPLHYGGFVRVDKGKKADEMQFFRMIQCYLYNTTTASSRCQCGYSDYHNHCVAFNYRLSENANERKVCNGGRRAVVDEHIVNYTKKRNITSLLEKDGYACAYTPERSAKEEAEEPGGGNWFDHDKIALGSGGHDKAE